MHMVLDNLRTHSTPEVNRWFERHPRFKLHFTPSRSSWLNMVESWFSQLTQKQIRRNSFRHARDVISAINEFVENIRRTRAPSSGPSRRTRY